MVIHLEKKMERLNSGEQRFIFGTILCTFNIGLRMYGRARWQDAEATRTYFQYCTDSSRQEILFLRALQCHSGRNLIDPSLQDNVLILNNFFEYTCHIGCAINLHSIIDSGLIPGGQKFEQKTDGILHVCGSYEQKKTEIRTLTWKHRGLHGTIRKSGRNTKTWCIGSTSNLLKRKDLSSIKHDRTQSSFTTHSQHIVSRRLY